MLTRPRPLPLTLIATTLVALCAAGKAEAQDSRSQLEPPQPENPILRFERPRQWRVRSRITLIPTTPPEDYTPVADARWRVDVGAVVFPFIRATASATGDDQSLEGFVSVTDEKVALAPRLIIGFHSLAEYAAWEFGRVEVTSIRMEQQADLIAWETVYDEDAANAVAWPKGPWPPEAASTFGPQQFVSPVPSSINNEGPVNALLAAWTEGNDPKSIAPARLAKFLAGRVQEHVRIVRPPSTTEPSADRFAEPVGVNVLTGLDLQTTDETALLREGTKHDLTSLLAAVYRAAGLPARIVIGYDRREPTRERLRSWVEFCLIDEPTGSVVWIPVDIARIRERSNRAADLDRPWEFFGTHDELDDIPPLALHYHPPMDVRAYNAPALYGWIAAPGIPVYARQFLNVDVTRTPTRGAD
ncbi:MAG: transglutaminase-like domain-containing protein [Planctomycetota bacterium]